MNIPVGLAASALVPATASAATDPPTAYVANAGSNTVTPIDVATNTPGTPIPVGNFPFGVAVTPDGATAYVANLSSNSVTPITVATNTAGTAIPVGTTPSALAITPAAQVRATSTQLSVTPASPAAAGTAETLTATVTPASAVGSVQFLDGVTPLGSPVTVTGGSASLSTTLASGTHSLSAVFTPTNPAAFTASTSNTVPYLVNPAITHTTLSVTPASPAVAGTGETLTATLTPASAVGSVQFKDGATLIGSPVTVTGGSASLSTTLPVGTNALSAVFTPTNPAAFTASTSNTVPYVVYATATHITLTVAPNPAFHGIPVVLIATVTPFTAAGTVQFFDGTTPLGAPVPVLAGVAFFTTSALTTGTHTLTAVFTPTNPTAFGPSTSPPVPLTVRSLL